MLMPASTQSLESFIDEDMIWRTLDAARNPDPAEVHDILDKAAEAKGLNLAEVATLLTVKDKALDEALFATARAVKEHIYGNRVVLFAPLYVTNECANACAYCGFNTHNKELTRRTLTLDAIREEVEVLEEMGHKRVLAVYGEHKRVTPEWMAGTVEAIYAVKTGKSGEVRRVNVNCAPMDAAGYATLKAAGIGTYQCFQETYHQETYKKVHLSGKKTDFLWRLYALHRAQEGGVDDVASGVLFGLFDHRFEVLALLAHAAQLEKDFGVGPHTVSFPRIEPALGSPMSYDPPAPIGDEDFKRVVAIVRLALPYTGMIMSTRETAAMRHELCRLGVSQISAGSRVYPGAYKDSKVNRMEAQQFFVGDDRPLDEVIYDLAENLDSIPSFCTSCYRLGRTGDHFMGLAKSAFIGKYCQPNALTTFKEYLLDYASPRTKAAGEALIARELAKLAPKRIAEVNGRLGRIEDGERDLYV